MNLSDNSIMKQIATLLAGMLTCMAAAAVTPANHGKYVLVPADGTLAAGGHFVAQGENEAVILTDAYSDAAVWQWDFVPGTATVQGHYTLSNLKSGAFLFTAGAEGVSVTSTDTAIKRSTSNVCDEAHNFAADGTFLAAAAGGRMTTASEAGASTAFLVIAYDANLSADEMLQKVTAEAALVSAKTEAIADLRKLFEACYTGARYADQVLESIRQCADMEELATARTEVRRTAIRMFESDMEAGATWQQQPTGLYVACTDGRYTGVESVSTEAFWYAEFTDNGNTIMDNRKFYLRNSHSKEYLAAPKEGTAVSGMPSRAGATLWRVVVNPGGLAITVDADDTNASLLYLDGEKVLSVIRGADAPAAATYIGEIKTYGEGVSSIAPMGTTEIIDGTEALTSVSSLRLTIARGSRPQADGVISLTYRKDGNSAYSTLATVSAASLPTPEATSINVDYYNREGQHITGTVEVDIYTIMLPETYEEGGEYMARVGIGCFELDGAYNMEFAGYAIVATGGLWPLEITPAEGAVESLTKIIINGPNGVYANLTGAADESVTLLRDGEQLAEYPVSDFAEGGKFDSYDIDADDPVWFTIPCDYTAAGRYSLVIPQGFFIDNNSKPCSELTVVWEIADSGAIRAVEAGAQADSTAYDLQGRKVSRPHPGRVYIVGGRKALR